MADPTPAEQEPTRKRIANAKEESRERREGLEIQAGLRPAPRHQLTDEWLHEIAAGTPNNYVSPSRRTIRAITRELLALRAALAQQRECPESVTAATEELRIALNAERDDVWIGMLTAKIERLLDALDPPSAPAQCEFCNGSGKCGVCEGTGKSMGEGCWACGIGSKPGVCESCRGTRVFTDDEIRVRLDAGDPTLEADMRRAAIERGERHAE